MIRQSKGPAVANRCLNETQRALAAQHVGLVESVVRRMRVQRVQFDELLSIGRFALVDAAAQFDPQRGVPFTGFACVHIRWAVLVAMRNERKHLRRSAEGYAPCEVYALKVSEQSADELIIQRERCEGLASAVHGLSDDKRSLIEEHYFAGVDLKAMLPSYATARRRHKSALDSLRRVLK